MNFAIQTVLFINSNQQTVIPQSKLLDVFGGRLGYPELTSQQAYLVSTDKNTGKLLFINPITFDKNGLVDQKAINDEILAKLNASEVIKQTQPTKNGVNEAMEIAVHNQIEAFASWKANPDKINTEALVMKTVILNELLLPILRQYLQI